MEPYTSRNRSFFRTTDRKSPHYGRTKIDGKGRLILGVQDQSLEVGYWMLAPTVPEEPSDDLTVIDMSLAEAEAEGSPAMAESTLPNFRTAELSALAIFVQAARMSRDTNVQQTIKL